MCPTCTRPAQARVAGCACGFVSLSRSSYSSPSAFVNLHPHPHHHHHHPTTYQSAPGTSRHRIRKLTALQRQDPERATANTRQGRGRGKQLGGAGSSCRKKARQQNKGETGIRAQDHTAHTDSQIVPIVTDRDF